MKKITQIIRSNFVAKLMVLLAFVFILWLILYNHYIEEGECAARVYYYPIDRWDFFIIPMVGIIMLFISLHFIPSSKKFMAVETLLYVGIVIGTLLWGNDMLASITLDWPEVYHPTPYVKEKWIQKKQLVGSWVKMSGDKDPDIFLTDTIIFAEDNMFYNGDSTYYHTYEIVDENLVVHRPNRALKKFEAIIVSDTLKLKLLNTDFFEIDYTEIVNMFCTIDTVQSTEVDSVNSVLEDSSLYGYIRIKRK